MTPLLNKVDKGMQLKNSPQQMPSRVLTTPVETGGRLQSKHTLAMQEGSESKTASHKSLERIIFTEAYTAQAAVRGV
ncbi:hypothetical protein Cadr_000023457 [Camelus dromedarius]|uniref:Uncharacterized protein n=1 Tax=Camelus dromedarius TaxID=9838 RepID=A0A5N4CIV4_CAMDR|nr:hypothetical protein Cadr_000023457 [Camelus dromedarius]